MRYTHSYNYENYIESDDCIYGNECDELTNNDNGNDELDGYDPVDINDDEDGDGGNEEGNDGGVNDHDDDDYDGKDNDDYYI